MLYDFEIKTESEGFYNITSGIKVAIARSGVKSGLGVVFCPHTTAGITINENADPDVVDDLIYGLRLAFPNHNKFRHAEGNSAAHLKASCIGSSVTIIIEKGLPLLGTWQGIFFCEFDGPRRRRYQLKVV